ncbi:hypothetical protein LWC34_09795 [Kibdelosporangium philippinense]|uniref:Outer membrane channel protein CpnT-like N-terminal domain-containing protein n=1 Tax=Kibdelosporangium philippinense TaxID=211113 RepID=A0ABS8Z5E9_9PSEU|nr:hypothetical protein [Kibdelosporangium philippinense]MCE7003119.1 hypothetical protein [Kibdelosporangium philippinense]
MAAQEVPDAVQGLLAVVVGNNWPEYNAADLQAMASQWRAAGERVAGVIAQIETGAAHVERGLTGPAYEAFRGFIAPLIVNDHVIPQGWCSCNSPGPGLCGV